MGKNCGQGLHCRSLVEEMRSAKHMHLLYCTIVVPFPLLYSTKLSRHALSVNLIEDNCAKIGQREGA